MKCIVTGATEGVNLTVRLSLNRLAIAVGYDELIAGLMPLMNRRGPLLQPLPPAYEHLAPMVGRSAK